VIRSRLETWQITLSEARDLDNYAPLTAADMTEMQEVYGLPQIGRNAPAPSPAIGSDQGGDNADGQPAEQDPNVIEAKAWTPDEFREASEFANRRELLAVATA
jgi:hypothetical protein